MSNLLNCLKSTGEVDGALATSTSNLPRGPHYWTNRNRHRLYARAWLPRSAAATKGVIAWVHGYGGHINRPHLAQMSNALASHGFAVVGYDHEGHGYSEGEHVYIENYKSLVDDFLQFLATLLDSGRHHTLTTPSVFKATLLSAAQPGLVGLVPAGFDLSRVPLFIAGESMGGALALHISQRLSAVAADSHPHPSAARFRGAILSAPMIHMNLPPAPVVWLLKNAVAPLLPHTCMPACLDAGENLLITRPA